MKDDNNQIGVSQKDQLCLILKEMGKITEQDKSFLYDGDAIGYLEQVIGSFKSKQKL